MNFVLIKFKKVIATQRSGLFEKYSGTCQLIFIEHAISETNRPAVEQICMLFDLRLREWFVGFLNPFLKFVRAPEHPIHPEF
jgi:hypothetical protein